MKEFIRSIILRVLTIEARLVLRMYHPRLLVITGSVGKTSTKDAAYAALTHHAFVRKSEKSYNSDIGVPLTVLGVPNGWGNMLLWAKNIVDGLVLVLIKSPYPQWLIVEVGADRPGDISRALNWLTPHIVVATRIPTLPVHVEFYLSPEQVFEEETYPLSRIREGGTAVLNFDDARLKEAALPVGVRRMTYGVGAGADVRATRFRTLTARGLPSGISFDIQQGTERAHVSLAGALGSTHASALAAGVAAALAAGMSLPDAVSGMTGHLTPPGRMRLIPGLKETMLIDDTYNASPVAAEEALHALKAAPTRGRKIALLGDMLELGTYSADEHVRVGHLAAECADLVVAVGVRARAIAEGALRAGKPDEAVKSFERGPDAASYLLSTMAPGDVILVKGSQSMRLERVVKALMHEPEKAKELLCRQDAEWLAR